LVALSVCNVFVIDEDLGDGELRNCGHAALFLLVHCAAETARPVECVEETYYNVTAYGFFNSLETGSASEELLEPGFMLV
jgi:hypothetical protein